MFDIWNRCIMATDFEKVSSIENADGLLISSYLTSINHSQFDVPPIVYNLCVLYWMQSDHFAVHSDHIVVNDDDADSTALSIVVRSADLSTETLMIHDRFESQHTRSVYGDFAINDDNPRGVYQWTFVIAENHSNIAIGICTTTKYVDNWYTWKIGKDSLEEFY